MTRESGKAPDERDERPQPKERGGAADIDRSKGMGSEEADSPFGGGGEGSGKPKKEA
jgi:hypothetical protein